MRWIPSGFLRAGLGRLVVGLVAGALVVAGVGCGGRTSVKPKPGDRPDDKTAKIKQIEVVPDKEKPGPETKKETPPSKGQEQLLAAGKQLFITNCLQCHGEKGQGDGAAAKYLHPKPRDFSEGNFRIVSTANAKPSDKDLFNVISRGMPGSVMIPFGHLTEDERWSLVAYVRQLTLTGFAERRKQALLDQGEEANMAEIIKTVETVFKPGPEVEVPKEFPTSSKESLAQGRELYVKVCASCHGEQGKGDGSQEQKNTDGTPTRPRDLTLGLYKGGRDAAQLYARMWLGMPGSPMPSAATAIKADEVGHIINYVHSLSPPELAAKVEYKRMQLVAKKVPSLEDGISADVWQSAESVPIVVSPLWWRSYTLPELQVAAIHDGTELAFRLVWKDETKNDSVARPEDFEDMVAVQLFKGKPEPFLGMGAEGANLDLWLWRSTWQRLVADVQPSLLDDYPFDMPVYKKILNGKNKQGKEPPPDFLTARAAGNQHVHADAKASAGNLAAKGFGSLTFRPKASQLVTAKSDWKDGTWTVVLRRSLKVGADDGLPFASGEQGSVAFAIWDGAARDRNGQKLISIWHDLKIE